MINQVQGPALQAALEAHKVPYVVKVFESAPHCIGVGDNTDAELADGSSSFLGAADRCLTINKKE